MASGSADDTVKQLDHARDLCLAEPTLYSRVVPSVTTVISATADIQLRRWGSEFIAETFASPVLVAEHKQKLSVQVLDTLKGYLDKPDEDATVVKSAIQAAASIYPFVFRHM